MKNFSLLILMLGALASCVSKKAYLDLQSKCNTTDSVLAKTRDELRTTEQNLNNTQGDLKISQNRADLLESQVTDLKNTNNSLMERVSELAKTSQTGIETLRDQNQFIKDLTNKIQQKDSINLILVTNLKRSLDNVNDDDINIQVKKGVVYISIADKVLFRSGSSSLSGRADEVLGKVAKVINDHRTLEVLVEGHTDDNPISTSCIKDNWDLSVQRSTSVVRTLQKQFRIDPARMTAAGRSEYVPKASNSTAEGRAMNRRTEIILTPDLEQFYELLQDPNAQKN